MLRINYKTSLTALWFCERCIHNKLLEFEGGALFILHLFFVLFLSIGTLDTSLVFGLDSMCAIRDKTVDQVPLFYGDARPRLGFSNFGDAMSVGIVERILGRPILTTTTLTPGQKKFLAIGSIVTYAEEGDVLWGTGVNGTYSKKEDYHFTSLDVRSVRGPLSRQFLLNLGVVCPEIYGDPTLLLPRLFPEFEKSKNPSQDYIIIPHYSDEHLFCHSPNMVSVKEDWKAVVRKILDSKFVISSALSGVIVAEAFGIPARLLVAPNQSNTENIFKYADYYYGTNRPNFRFASSIEEALRMGGESMPDCNLDALLQAFPYDLFDPHYFYIKQIELPEMSDSVSRNNDLMNELESMVLQDQKVRECIGSKDLDIHQKGDMIAEVDRMHLPRLKKIIEQFGWPGFELVGEEGAENMWLLVQHCDEDVQFQKECLVLLEAAVARQDASKRHLAYLLDRILVHDGKEQLYGTQVSIRQGDIIVCPIQEPDDLDRRRQAMGLSSFMEYLTIVREHYINW